MHNTRDKQQGSRSREFDTKDAVMAAWRPAAARVTMLMKAKLGQWTRRRDLLFLLFLQIRGHNEEALYSGERLKLMHHEQQQQQQQQLSFFLFHVFALR